MEKQEKIHELLQDYEDQRLAGEDYTNHWIRRFYRCFIDGSYNGRDHYIQNVNTVIQWRDDKSGNRLLDKARGEFIGFLVAENLGSPTTVRRAIMSSGIDLGHLDNELLEDLKELAEGIEVQLK